MTIPKLIYHYTNIEALINGIFNLNTVDSEKENDICLWATNCEYLNDPIDSYLGDILMHNNQEIKSFLKAISFHSLKVKIACQCGIFTARTGKV